VLHFERLTQSGGHHFQVFSLSAFSSFGGSTHKTFPGPQKGIVATGDPEIAGLLRATQPYVISSHHYGATCALGLALAFFAQRCPSYPRTVVANARALGAHLAERGLPPEGAAFGYSHGHQLWIRTAPHGISAAHAAGRLHEAGIRTNFLTDLPGIAEPALRLGVNEATWLGLTPAGTAELADIITTATLTSRPARELAARVAALRSHLPGDTCPPDILEPARQIIRSVFGKISTDTAAGTP
jgi:glycine hydroxymethyltransferase